MTLATAIMEPSLILHFDIYRGVSKSQQVGDDYGISLARYMHSLFVGTNFKVGNQEGLIFRYSGIVFNPEQSIL